MCLSYVWVSMMYLGDIFGSCASKGGLRGANVKGEGVGYCCVLGVAGRRGGVGLSVGVSNGVCWPLCSINSSSSPPAVILGVS